MFGLPFTLSDSAQESDDSAWLFKIGFDHNWLLTDDVVWQTYLSFNRTDYHELDDLDTNIFSGSTGPSWKITDKIFVSTPLVTDWVRMDRSDIYYSSNYGMAPQLKYSLAKELSLNLLTTLSKKRYRDNHERDSDNYSLSPSIAYQFTPVSFARIGLTLGKENSGLDYYSNDVWGVNAMYNHVFPNALRLTLNAIYTDTDYSGKEAAYDQVRHDKNKKIGAQIAYNISAINTDLLVSGSLTFNDSNLEIYEYDRDQLSISLQKRF